MTDLKSAVVAAVAAAAAVVYSVVTGVVEHFAVDCPSYSCSLSAAAG